MRPQEDSGCCGCSSLTFAPTLFRSTSESSASFPRSPGQPSSLRSDDGLGPPVPPPEEDRYFPLSLSEFLAPCQFCFLETNI